MTLERYRTHARAAWPADIGLKPWEEEWFSEDLPPPPAGVLVGGAGKGREANALSNRGYQVVAFDPVGDFVDEGIRNPAVRFLSGSYGDLVDPNTPHALGMRRHVESAAPFRAVVLGWGSFSHLPSRRERVDLLKRCRALCPRGPLLASFWLVGTVDDLPEGRARAWGIKLGRALAGRSARSADRGDCITAHMGYCHSFTRKELEEVAGQADYRLARLVAETVDIYPHATFQPA